MFLRRIAALVCACAFLGAASAVAEPPRAITLAQALKRTVAANPRLAVAEREIGIAAGRRIQAGAIPNPEIGLDVENVAGSGPYRGTRSAETTLQIGQLIEFPGKRDARLTAASAEIETARWQRQSERLEVLSETAVTFVTILGAQRRIEIFDGLIASLDGMLPLLQRRIDAGASSPADVSRAQVAADLIRVERERTKTALQTARRELATLMGLTAPDFGTAVGDFGSTARLPAVNTLLASVDDHPQLSRWTSIRAQRRAELLSARLKPAPDFRISAGWRHFRETGDNAAVFGLSAAIPLWDQNQGAIIAAQETLAKTEAERAANKATLLVVLGRAYEAAAGAQRELALLQGSVIPKARTTIRAIEDGYAQGRFTLLEVLDAQATFSQALQREQEALVSFHTAIATIEWLAGTPILLTRTRPR
jgi:cobalt-zinc-cadmium efflux system outer membrane protein